MDPDPLHEKTEEVLTRIEDTHAEIRAACAVISDPASFEALVGALQDLVNILPVHFLDEERKGGLFDRLRRRSPQASAAVETLVNDHRRFLSELDEMMTDDNTDTAELRAWARSFARRLGEHEFRENALAAAPPRFVRG